jgi:hypothetical protein
MSLYIYFKIGLPGLKKNKTKYQGLSRENTNNISLQGKARLSPVNPVIFGWVARRAVSRYINRFLFEHF